MALQTEYEFHLRLFKFFESKLNAFSLFCSFVFLGIIILLLTYIAMGSILFMTLEGEEDMGKTVETAVAASKPRTDLVNADIRSR